MSTIVLFCRFLFFTSFTVLRKPNDKVKDSTTWKTVVDLWANWEKQEASEEAAEKVESGAGSGGCESV